MSVALRRARPALGTLVEFRVEGLDEAAAVRAIAAAYAEVQTVHRLMSFHQADSDLARLHRTPVGAILRVDARTHEVLDWALRIAAASRGYFDPTIAVAQVAAGRLPRPDSAWTADRSATWRDIELLDGERVRLHRRLWIDLGGIAKGYAVDRAIEVLQAHGAAQACVNAGGDLRVFGPCAERVHVRAGGGCVAVLEVADGAVASSAAATALHGSARTPVASGTTASVVAARCTVADALTKVILCAGEGACCQILDAFDASAAIGRGGDWRLLSAAA